MPRVGSWWFGLGALVLAIAGAPSPAWASCDRPKSDTERAQCLGIELKGADATINRVYTSLMSALPAGDRTTLRTEQRAWIASRDKACGIGSSQGDRDAWFAALLKDFQKTVCVVRLTNERVQTLADYQRANRVTPPAPATPASAGTTPVYDLSSPTPRQRGKYYFEIRIDPAAIRKQAEAALFVGVDPASVDAASIDPNGSAVGKLVTIRRIDTDDEPGVYGFAMDLDNGKVYLSENGEWDGGAPGTSGGMDIIRGRTYQGSLTSSIDISAFLQSKAIVVNWGASGFVYRIPDGYRPLEARAPAPPPALRPGGGESPARSAR